MARTNSLHSAQKIHCFGAGGIGMSAVARFLLSEGKTVSGSDTAESEITAELRALGARISLGQSLADIPNGADLLIYSAAIPVADPDFFAELRRSRIPALSYAEALGEMSRGKCTVAVAGTHGKTTTTAMLAKILMDAGRAPTVIVGSLIRTGGRGQARTNFVKGESDLFVLEADEYRRNFLSLHPAVLIVNNIDIDHLDYYKDLADIQSAFAELAARVPKDGAIVADLRHPNIGPVIRAARAPVLDYGGADGAGLRLKLPGAHNRDNARAALTAADFLGVPRGRAVQSLSDFSGVARRFEYMGETKRGALVYDDYAHNPPKVRAALSGAREIFPGRRIIAAFQPHLYSRTKTLFSGLAAAFALADEIVLAPIFPAREPLDPSISSEMLAQAIGKNEPGKPLRVAADLDDMSAYLARAARRGDVVLTIGAGDIYKVAKNLTARP